MPFGKINGIIKYQIKSHISLRRYKLPETNRVEYKRELNDRLERAVVSFLNFLLWKIDRGVK